MKKRFLKSAISFIAVFAILAMNLINFEFSTAYAAAPAAPEWVDLEYTSDTTATATWDTGEATWWYAIISTSDTFQGWDGGVGSGCNTDETHCDFSELTPEVTYYVYVSAVDPGDWSWNEPTRSDAELIYAVTYTAGDGGSIEGDLEQAVEEGGDGTEVTAVADDGYRFVSWDDGYMEESRQETNVTENMDLTANFEADEEEVVTYTLTYTAGEGGSIEGDLEQTVEEGGNGTEVTAVPDDGYEFINWSDTSTDNPRTDANVTDDISVTANFEVVEEEDETPPIITLIGVPHIVVYVGAIYEDEGATAEDETDGDITENIVTGGDEVDLTTPGTYQITYNVSDAAENPATEVVRTIDVVSEEETESTIETEEDTHIYIPEDVTDGTLNVSEFTEGGSATIPNNVTIETETSEMNINIDIPAGITITSEDDSWDGIMNLPQVTTATVTPTDGYRATVLEAIEVGLGDTEITFDKGVRILFEGQADKKVGWTRGGDFTEVTTVCTTDSQEWADENLGESGDCKMNVGDDLVVWTKHFTKYVIYTETLRTGGGGVILTSNRNNTNKKAEETFEDVPETDENFEAIEYLNEEEIIKGTDDNTYDPKTKLNRAEFTKIVVDYLKATPTIDVYKNCFPDVKEEWYAPYICYAKEKGWVNGYGAGKFKGLFKPEKEINKAESLKILLKSKGIEVSTKVTNKPFDDVPVDSWFAGFIAKSKELGLFDITTGKIIPEEIITKGMTAEYIYRIITALENLEK